MLVRGALPGFRVLLTLPLQKHLLSRRGYGITEDSLLLVGEINCLVARNNFIYTRLPLLSRGPAATGLQSLALQMVVSLPFAGPLIMQTQVSS